MTLPSTKRLLLRALFALFFFLLGILTGAELILCHPRLPLSAITIDMRSQTFRFKNQSPFCP